jgi:hypothetical protein
MDEHPERRWYGGRVGAFAKRDCAVLKGALFAEGQCSDRIAWPLLALSDGVTVRALTDADHAGVPDLMQRDRRTVSRHVLKPKSAAGCAAAQPAIVAFS